MVSTAREVERKYELSADRVLPGFRSLAGVSAQPQTERDILQAVYYDTPDLRLAAAGITLRRRTGGSDAGWHLKIPAGTDTRDEIRSPADADAGSPPAADGGDVVPEPLRDRVLHHTRNVELRPIAQITTNRARWLLRDGAGSVLAEFVLDTVSALAWDITATAAWQEIEVELVSGDEELLDRVDNWLADSGIRRAAAPSKLARLLGDLLPARQPAVRKRSPRKLRPRTPAGEVVRAYLAGQVQRLHALDPAVRADAPDAVHQMRVTSRRLRSALRTFRLVLDTARANRIRDELAWLARVLGGARDAEVMAAQLGVELGELPADLAGGPVGAAIAHHFASEHAAAHRLVRDELKSPRYLALLDALDEMLAQPIETAAGLRKAKRTLPAEVSRSYRRLAAAVAAIERNPAGGRDAAIHEARKAAKRARYAAELAATALGKDARRFAVRLKEIQDLLGEHQDSVVARAELLRLREQLPASVGGLFALGVLYGQQRVRADRVEEQIPAAWKRLASPKHRAWLR